MTRLLQGCNSLAISVDTRIRRLCVHTPWQFWFFTNLDVCREVSIEGKEITSLYILYGNIHTLTHCLKYIQLCCWCFIMKIVQQWLLTVMITDDSRFSLWSLVRPFQVVNCFWSGTIFTCLSECELIRPTNKVYLCHVKSNYYYNCQWSNLVEFIQMVMLIVEKILTVGISSHKWQSRIEIEHLFRLGQK